MWKSCRIFYNWCRRWAYSASWWKLPRYKLVSIRFINDFWLCWKMGPTSFSITLSNQVWSWHFCSGSKQMNFLRNFTEMIFSMIRSSSQIFVEKLQVVVIKVWRMRSFFTVQVCSVITPSSKLFYSTKMC